MTRLNPHSSVNPMDPTTVCQGHQTFRSLALLCRLRCVKSNAHTEGALPVQLAALWAVQLLIPESTTTAK